MTAATAPTTPANATNTPMPTVTSEVVDGKTVSTVTNVPSTTIPSQTNGTGTLPDIQPVSGYTPKFSDKTRTVLYFVCFILGNIGFVFSVAALATNAPQWVFLASVAFSYLAFNTASAFGIAYNPMKLASKQ